MFTALGLIFASWSSLLYDLPRRMGQVSAAWGHRRPPQDLTTVKRVVTVHVLPFSVTTTATAQCCFPRSPCGGLADYPNISSDGGLLSAISRTSSRVASRFCWICCRWSTPYRTAPLMTGSGLLPR